MLTHFCKCCRFAIGLGTLVIGLGFSPSAFAATVIRYVDTNITTSGNGLTWGTAKTYLQDGISDATAYLSVPGHENDSVQVWVAQGTYFPDQDTGTPGGTGDPDAWFELHDSISLYGGFAGTETTLGQRNPKANLTILSGDLDGDDEPDFVNYDENSHQIVFSTGVGGTAVLDGFTVRGAANSGIYNYQGGSPTVSNCILTANLGDYGGGMHNSDSSSPIVINCSFIGNQSGTNGGGMYCVDESTPKIVNCKFINNTSGHVGGGLSLRHSGSDAINVTNCLFQGNSSPDSGGGVRAGVDTHSIFTNCTFSGNTTGGGSPGFPVGGGGFALGSDGSVSTTRTSELHNCIFWDNHVTGTADGPDVAINGVTYGLLVIDHTNVPDGESGVFIDFNTSPPPGIDPLDWGSGNKDVDPNFANATYGNFRLKCPSDCINAGLGSSVPADAEDVNGNSNLTEATPDLDIADRIVNSEVDMGAYEATSYTVCGGDCTGGVVPGTPNCTVNIDDLLAVINSWGTCPSCTADIAPASPCSTGNGSVDIDDLLLVINTWGDCNCAEGGIAGGSAYPATTINECMDAASENFEPFSEDWTNYVNGCLEYLCRHQLIECDG